MPSHAGIKGVQGLKNEKFYEEHYHGTTTTRKYNLDKNISPKFNPTRPPGTNTRYTGRRHSNHRNPNDSNTIFGVPPEEVAGGTRRTKRKRSKSKKLKRKSYRKYNARKTTN
jgi:hypothetical protein